MQNKFYSLEIRGGHATFLAVPVLDTLLKVPAVPVLENQGTFVGTFQKKIPERKYCPIFCRFLSETGQFHNN